MSAKTKIPPALWVIFVLVDLAIVAAVLIAFFWVAPIPAALGGDTTLAAARAQQPAEPEQPTPLVVAVVTADWCLSCQMYKRGALANPRFTAWVSEHATAAHLKWGVNDTDIATLNVDRYPATVLLAGESILATHYGSMSIDELIAFLEQAAAARPAPVDLPANTPPVESTPP